MVSVCGLLGTLVRGFQSNSASRVGLATPVNTPSSAPVIALRASLVKSSDDGSISEISSMKSLVANIVMVNYIMHRVPDTPHNLVIKNAKYPERDRIRVIRVMDYMMTFATNTEKLKLKNPQPPKSSSLWTAWYNSLKEICNKLQARAMAAIFARSNKK